MYSKWRLATLLLAALLLPPAIMLAQQAGGANGAVRPQGPCDIYASAGTPCVAAHSTVRALSASYNGPLYQVRRESDGRTLDIGIVPPTAAPAQDAGGYADAAAQDAFCAGTLCVITCIYDQSGKANHLFQAAPGTFFGPAKGGFDTLPIADMAPVTLKGHKVYGVYIMPGMGFRNNNATDLPIDDEPEGIYSVMDGTHYDSGCCFDYGNASTNGRAVGTGTMETTYFGISTTWGSGNGNGPWLMADMEAGLFSGYNARKNDVPSIDSWRFVTAIVNGGGGNKWDLRGGNAQKGELTTYYSGVRPGTPNSSSYFPMHKQGAVLLGTGGDNGNGSSGTFYEGVMTRGYPTDAAINAVQANIVAAHYDVAPVSLSRLTTFTPGTSQEVTATFTNVTDRPVSGVTLNLAVSATGDPAWGSAWISQAAGTTDTTKTFSDPIVPGASVSAKFKVTAPAATGAGHLTAKAQWTSQPGVAHADAILARVRNTQPVKINEVQIVNGANQFIELHNAGDKAVDLSNWALIHTQSQWAPVGLATIPQGTTLAPKGYYLLGMSASALAAPAQKGDSTLLVRTTDGLAEGAEIKLDGETRKIARVGSSASPMTTIYIPVSTGPWLHIPAGATNVPVTSAAGFAVGQKMSIDLGGNLEIVTVTAVGKASTQTVLSATAPKGATSIRVAAGTNLSVGDTLTIGTGARMETSIVKSVSVAAAGEAPAGAPGGGGRAGRGGGPPSTVELTAPLKMDHAPGVDVASTGTGVSFSPATKFPHTSGDAVQALGSGITLDSPLAADHTYGAPVVNAQAGGYQGPAAPQQWFGVALSTRAGSLALMDASGKVVVDAVVYGSQQSNSSANGTIASPELATLEGDQGKGGCIVVVPAAGRGGPGGRGGTPAAGPGRSASRVPDGADADSNCNDFKTVSPTPGASNASQP